VRLEDVREGADVVSADGHTVGKLSRLVVKEGTLEITHLVVDPGLLHRGESIWRGGWGNPHERVIPAGVLEDEDETGGVIHITMSAEEFRDLSVNYDKVYAKADPNRLRAAINSMPGGLGPWVFYDVMEKDPDEVDIKDGSPVWRLRPHQKIGDVERVLFNEETLRVQALVIRRGHFFSHEVVLPARYIVEVVEVLWGIVRVDISDDELRALKPYESPEAPTERSAR
jgi:sporulation protein YlmC with PRC-barrel domain